MIPSMFEVARVDTDEVVQRMCFWRTAADGIPQPNNYRVIMPGRAGDKLFKIEGATFIKRVVTSIFTDATLFRQRPSS